MPGGDRTGPGGMGPMTGRAAGYCAGYQVPGFMNPVLGRGFGGGGPGGRPGLAQLVLCHRPDRLAARKLWNACSREPSGVSLALHHPDVCPGHDKRAGIGHAQGPSRVFRGQP